MGYDELTTQEIDQEIHETLMAETAAGRLTPERATILHLALIGTTIPTPGWPELD